MRNTIAIPSDKLKSFCAVLEAAQLASLIENGVDCEANRQNAKTHFHVGGKYARVDIGGSGRYMVVLATGEIFGIKAYGVIHRGHAFGTLDTIAEWDWRNYRACRAVTGAAALAREAARREFHSYRPSRTADALAVVSPLAWNSVQMDNEVALPNEYDARIG